MANLLMIESWVGASGNLLPPLLKSLGHSYTFVTRKPEHYKNPHSSELHAVFKHASDMIVVETNDTDKILNAVKGKSFDGVITVCDYYIEIVREVASSLDLPCPFPKNVKSIREKHTMRQMLDKSEIENPKYLISLDKNEVQKGVEKIGYPLILKPVDLASSAFVKLINSDQELEEACDNLSGFPLNFRDQPRNMSFLLEEYMEGNEVSIETISFNGETIIVGITDKSVTGNPCFIENGHMFPADLDKKTEKDLNNYIKTVLKAVGYDHGIAHTEIKLTKDGFKVVEINPRTAGNYIVELIENVTGINMLKVFVDLSLGKKPEIIKKDTGVKSSAIMFYVPLKSGKITDVCGKEQLDSNSNVLRYKIEDCVGKHVDSAVDNACYLAHIVTKSSEGKHAREYAEEALKLLDFQIEEGE